jgi:ATP-dependent Lon protease
MMVLSNREKEWKHHSVGVFTNPVKRTSFEFDEKDGTVSADILRIDARFVSLLQWLCENHISVRLSGRNTEEGYVVYRIREIAFGGGTKLSAEDGFLQFMIERLLASSAPEDDVEDDDAEETGDGMKLTSLQSITDFMMCAGKTLPNQIRLWARRNLAVARSGEVSQEERRHAQLKQSLCFPSAFSPGRSDSLHGDSSSCHLARDPLTFSASSLIPKGQYHIEDTAPDVEQSTTIVIYLVYHRALPSSQIKA